MKLKEIQNIVEEVYPKIEKHYGYSKFMPEMTPYIEYETSIYGRLSGEEDDGTFGEQTPHAEWVMITTLTHTKLLLITKKLTINYLYNDKNY